MLQRETTVLNQQTLGEDYRRLLLRAPQIARRAHPGQFVNVRCRQGYYPLLRRPFSILAVDSARGEVELLYRIRGEGTRALAELSAGCRLDVLGPLGKGFVLPGKRKQARKICLIAGGTGVAPLYFLALRLCQRGFSPLVFLGGKSRQDVLLYNDLRLLGLRVSPATEDGSWGFPGRVTTLVEQTILKENKINEWLFYGCGPAPLLNHLCDVTDDYRIPLQISLETYIGCGTGICQGCAVKVRKGNGWAYRLACTDGPVFRGKDIIWED